MLEIEFSIEPIVINEMGKESPIVELVKSLYSYFNNHYEKEYGCYRVGRKPAIKFGISHKEDNVTVSLSMIDPSTIIEVYNRIVIKSKAFVEGFTFRHCMITSQYGIRQDDIRIKFNILSQTAGFISNETYKLK